MAEKTQPIFSYNTTEERVPGLSMALKDLPVEIRTARGLRRLVRGVVEFQVYPDTSVLTKDYQVLGQRVGTTVFDYIRTNL